MHLKRNVGDYARRNPLVTMRGGDVNETVHRITQDRAWATDVDIFLTASYLQREIQVYRHSYPHGHCFCLQPEAPPRDKRPLCILHVGPGNGTHFQALVPVAPEQPPLAQ